jgi:hypothetical protein
MLVDDPLALPTHRTREKKEMEERVNHFEFIFLKIQTYDIFLQVKTNLVTIISFIDNRKPSDSAEIDGFFKDFKLRKSY